MPCYYSEVAVAAEREWGTCDRELTAVSIMSVDALRGGRLVGRIAKAGVSPSLRGGNIPENNKRELTPAQPFVN